MTRARLALVLGSLTAFGPLSIDMYLPGLPGLARDLSATPASAQLTITFIVLGIGAGQLVAGPFSDARGRRSPLLVGLVAYALASIACALSGSIGVLVALRFLQGAAGGVGIVIARAVARDLYSGIDLARFLAVLMLVNGVAPILAPVLGGVLLHFGPWRLCFFVLAGIGVALAVATGFGLSESLPPERRSQGGVGRTLRVYGGLARDPRFAGYAVAMGLAFGTLFAYIASGPFVLEQVYGLSPQQFSFVFGGNAIGVVVMAQVGARLVGSVGPARLLSIGLGMELVGGIALVLATTAGAPLAVVIPCMSLIVASVGFVFPNATALALSDYGHQAGSASALLGIGQYVLGGILAPVAGFVPLPAALAMAVVMCVCSGAAALALFTSRRLTKPPPAREPA